MNVKRLYDFPADATLSFDVRDVNSKEIIWNTLVPADGIVSGSFTPTESSEYLISVTINNPQHRQAAFSLDNFYAFVAPSNPTDYVSLFLPDVLAYNDYYPFGQLVPNRHASTPAYRYGIQGQEKDDELKGEGNSLNYTFRMHDPRIGRFFAPDPLEKKYPNYTPYSFSGNKVINSVEIEGLEDSFYMLGKKIYNGEAYFELVNVLEVGGEVELITGTKMKTAFADRVHVYGSDGHWHTMSGKLRNTSLNNLGGSREIFAQINKGEIVDAGYEMASKLKSIERIGNTASAAIGLAYLGQALKDIKGVKSLVSQTKPLLIQRMRDRLLGSISNSKLKSTIDRLWRPGAKVGSGSTGDAIRAEKLGQTFTGSSNHTQKAQEELNTMKDLLKGNHGKLTTKDENVIHEVIQDLTTDTGLQLKGVNWDYLKNVPTKAKK